MTPRQKEKFRELLQKMRAAALREGPHRIEPNRTDDAAVGVADEDAQALSEMLQAISSSRNKGQAAMLARIDRALLKLRDAPGEYGLCEECEEEIAPRRLQLMPQATLCAECQAKADPRRGTTRRKITDYTD
ncbi:MAG: TraR/DksA family transcriptional regulator [Myxococcales bacterium]